MADIRQAKSKGREVVTVSGLLTVKNAKTLKATLSKALQNASEIEVNVEHIDEIDITLAQLICSAHRTAAGMNKQVTITGLEQERFSRLLVQSGFFRHIGCHDSTRKSCLWLHSQDAP